MMSAAAIANGGGVAAGTAVAVLQSAAAGGAGLATVSAGAAAGGAVIGATSAGVGIAATGGFRSRPGNESKSDVSPQHKDDSKQAPGLRDQQHGEPGVMATTTAFAVVFALITFAVCPTLRRSCCSYRNLNTVGFFFKR